MRRKKVKIAAIGIVILAIVSGVVIRYAMKSTDAVPYWTDMYMSGEMNEEYLISLTFFSEKKIDFSKLCGIELKGAQSYVSVENFEVEDMENKDYYSKAVSMNLKFLKKGEIQTDTLIFNYLDGSQKEYYPGEWSFDIGEKSKLSPEEDSTPGATSNKNTFGYDYKFSKNVTLEKIKIGVGKNITIHETKKVFMDKIQNDVEAPLVIIRPKVVTKDGIYYGNASYCGALYVDKKAIEKSFKHSLK